MSNDEKLRNGILNHGKETAQIETSQDWSPNGSSASTPTEAPLRTVIFFEPGDPENPCNWPWKKKIPVVIFVLNTVFNASISSALPSGGVAFIADYFHIHNEEQLVLPVSVYLVGYCCGPLAWGPLSETYGRKAVMIPAFCIFTIFTMACALAPTYPALCVFRFFVGIGAACAISIVGGVYADIYKDPVARGRAMSTFMVANCFGPILGPVVGGFADTMSWRWGFWIALIYAGVSLVPLILLPETYGPTILHRRAKRLRKETGNANVFAPIELEKKGFVQMATVILTRPIRMYLFEALVFVSCTYLALIFGILYLYFEAYPIIFQGIYHMSAGISALAFIPIAIGALFSGCIFLYYDRVLRKAQQLHKQWAAVEESRRLPLACIGGPLFAVSLFWLGWSANPNIHWIVPMLSGIPFGIGMLLTFMALVNYLTDAYEIYAASANAASSTTRSIFGAVMPFAAAPMYTRLGVHWATSLLGFISLAMAITPFAFIKYGHKIRANSKMCQDLAERKRMETNEEAHIRSAGEIADGRADSRDIRKQQIYALAEKTEDGRGEVKIFSDFSRADSSLHL